MRNQNGIGMAVVSLLLFSGCGDDNGPPAGDALLARGEYLVKHVAACGDCHTPRDNMGQLDLTKWLAGGPFADLDPSNDMIGEINAPNLTPDSTGLRNWTDAQIKTAFQDGRDANGTPLFPIMPYFIFHNMVPDDADAVVAYLRSIPAIRNSVPDRQPLGFPFTQPAQPVPVAAIPSTTLPSTHAAYQNAVRGRYLAALAGVCIECHTAEAPGNPVPLALDSLFAGGRPFEIGGPFGTVFAANITPDPTGIGNMTAEQVRTVLLQGIDEHGDAICPPMPVGPTGAFGGLTMRDALDIAWYVTTIPAIAKQVPDCVPPEPAP